MTSRVHVRWSWVFSSRNSNQRDRQSRSGRHYIHADKKLELLDFCISQEEQHKLERAAASTLSIPWALEEPPETWSLPAALGLTQPQLLLFSVLCSLAKAEGTLPHQDSSRIFPQRWHFSCEVTGERPAWLHPKRESFLRWFEVK